MIKLHTHTHTHTHNCYRIEKEVLNAKFVKNVKEEKVKKRINNSLAKGGEPFS